MSTEDLPNNHIPSVMEDPSTLAIAKMYAEAFVGAAQSVGVDAVLEEFESFLVDVLDSNPDFASFFCSSVGNRDDKLKLIERVVAPYGSELFTNFLRVLASKDRLDLLPLILRESKLNHEIRQGKKRVQVTSATELSDEQKERIRQQLSEKLPFDPIIESSVDPSLVGGIVVRVGDTVYDSSVRTRMKQLRERMRQRSLNEIQSGRDRFSHPEGD
ncbi:MAG: ATP synthase F1 subunit delta [Planctomycetaceae bacterium]|nr:ATP synthase F1 subunit delta [Planctomycetaceae bacterium]